MVMSVERLRRVWAYFAVADERGESGAEVFGHLDEVNKRWGRGERRR